MRELALANVLTEMLPALDAIGQARQHDELSGGFKSVAETIESAVSKLGLVTYGETGEPFDPKVHEAVATSYSPDVTDVTLTEISSRATRSATGSCVRPGSWWRSPLPARTDPLSRARKRSRTRTTSENERRGER